jgi:putative phosphoribosyl transferase
MDKVRIISDSSEPFADREEAGRLLAAELNKYQGQKAVVLGIPRGGVIVACEIRRVLSAELDIVLARKLRTPGHEELAMCSVTEDGKIFLNLEVIEELDVGESYIQREKLQQIAEIKRRAEIIRRVRPKITLEGRTAIITDDGVATGATTQAAFWAIRAEQPKQMVAAIPVGPKYTIMRLAKGVDEMICLRSPPLFAAVGQFFQRFDPVEDEDVLKILDESTRGS